MPFSSNAFEHYVGTLFDLLQPGRVCDIGPGEGKYSGIARRKAKEHGFACHLTAVEIDQSYVDTYDLHNLYDDVIVADAVTLINNPRCRFDLVIMGDCIEHMRKSDGIDLVNFLIYRTGYICIITPEALVQDDWEGHASEAHISVWSVEDFRGLNMLHRFHNGMHAFLLKGYQPSRMIITG
ncbi:MULTISPECIES: methyltransferase domain-containing protein [Mesorhizobium]|uniref:methyltransferase domain-containing protein n=1 Tax=Mesorhizobium TaxID=68287 RepID=UPI0010A96A13|nr:MULTISPECIES: class I SAM-dependent methyltransferase [Mesorhizobium]